MRMKFIASPIVILVLFLVFYKNILASEGEAELRSTTGDDSRCLVTSHLLQTRQYNLLIGCRDVIYPPDDNLSVYVIWSNPADGSNPVKIGEIGFGKVLLKTSKPFSSLFVTTEQKGYRTPSDRVVMRGNISPIPFLDRPSTPTPTPTPEDIDEAIDEDEPERALSTRERLVLGLRRAGLVALVALVALIGLIFVITRSRG